MLWRVLHEGLLRHVVGSPAIMREQLDKLAELAREPGVVIQILPFTASDHPGTDGPILVYDFDGGLVGGIYRMQRGRPDRRVG